MLLKLMALSLMTLMLLPVGNAEEGCKDETIFFQPGGSTLKSAASKFAFEAKHAISTCAVQDKVRVSTDQEVYVTGFRKLPDGSKIIDYQIDNFKNGFGTTKETCQVTVKSVPTVGSNGDSFKTVVSDPVCEVSELK
jgi:hypothetical protein